MDDRCGRGVDDDDDLDGEGVRDGGLSAKLAAYGESLALQRMLREAGERKGVDELFEVGVDEVSASIFKKHVVVGRRGDSPRVRDMRLLDSPRATQDPSTEEA
jgi:hypothetical protein